MEAADCRRIPVAGGLPDDGCAPQPRCVGPPASQGSSRGGACVARLEPEAPAARPSFVAVPVDDLPLDRVVTIEADGACCFSCACPSKARPCGSRPWRRTLEVKGVTLSEQERAVFSHAPSERFLQRIGDSPERHSFPGSFFPVAHPRCARNGVLRPFCSGRRLSLAFRSLLPKVVH